MASTDAKSSTVSKSVPTVTPSISAKTVSKPSAAVKSAVLPVTKVTTAPKAASASKAAPVAKATTPSTGGGSAPVAKSASTTKAAPVAKSASTTKAAPVAAHKSKVNGTLIGLIIGCVLAAAAIGVGIWLAIKNSKKKKKESYARTANSVTNPEKVHLGLVGNFKGLANTPRFTKQPFEPTMKESYTKVKKGKEITKSRIKKRKNIVPSSKDLASVEKALAKILDIDKIMVKVSHVQDVDSTEDMYVSVVIFEDDKNRYRRDKILKMLRDPQTLKRALPGIKSFGLGHENNTYPCPHASGLTNNGILIDGKGKHHKVGKEVRKCQGVLAGSVCLKPGDEFPDLEYQSEVDAKLCV